MTPPGMVDSRYLLYIRKRAHPGIMLAAYNVRDRGRMLVRLVTDDIDRCL
jgi:hypothetical protein